MADQKEIMNMGGTMRLGKYTYVLSEGTNSYEVYAEKEISERHRYEMNNAYRDKLSAVGLKIAGQSPNGRLVEIVEIPEHRWFIGAQFHPEFKIRPDRPHPLFKSFIYNSLLKRRENV